MVSPCDIFRKIRGGAQVDGWEKTASHGWANVRVVQGEGSTPFSTTIALPRASLPLVPLAGNL